MSFVEWTEDLSVGVKEIDDQHKELFGLINRVYEVDLEKDRDEGARILSELIELTRVHFTTEEDYFKLCNYPDAEEHIAAHMRYNEEVLQFQRDFEKGKYDYPVFLKLLKEWWEDHLGTMDRKYVENFRVCGLG